MLKFLKKKIEQENPEEQKLQVRNKFQATIQCDGCEYWGKMEGGVLVDDPQTAVFICPECESLKKVKWF
jgi:hypothetical protein